MQIETRLARLERRSLPAAPKPLDVAETVGALLTDMSRRLRMWRSEHLAERPLPEMLAHPFLGGWLRRCMMLRPIEVGNLETIAEYPGELPGDAATARRLARAVLAELPRRDTDQDDDDGDMPTWAIWQLSGTRGGHLTEWLHEGAKNNADEMEDGDDG